MPSIPQAFLNFKVFINFCMSHDLIIWGGGCCLRIPLVLELYTPPAVHGFHRTNHVMSTEFPRRPQLRWLSQMEEIWGLKHHE
jgi:coproporphyrinogen III oxidase